ncbi:MAG: HPr(Ser) kinase/phosphatase [Deltaproteobacteria bacterium]|nr:HPr(Ser) kinase/phosphatase [Deltaproteobacteria bacterium]
MLESRLLGLFNEKLHQRTTMHGVLVKKAIRGILIIGDSGSGKTASAMKLIERGYRWVADDVIQIERKDPEKLHGSGHGLTGRLIEIKGRGIVDSRSVFDSASLCSEAVIDLVISLSRKTERDGINSRHRMGKAFIEILGIRLPKYTLRSSRSIDETVDRIDSIVSRHGCSGGLP